MKSIHSILLNLLLSLAVFAEAPDFDKDVAPILNKYCVGCHASDEPEAKLRLDSFEHLVKGGENGPTIDEKNMANSLLLARITSVEDDIMPPQGEPRPAIAEVTLIAEWVKSGARGPRTRPQAHITQVKFDKIEPAKVPKSVTSLTYSPSGEIAVASFGLVEIFKEGEATLHLVTPGKVHDARFDSTGTKLVAASGVAGVRGEAILWDAKDGGVIRRFQGHNDTIYAIAISEDASLLATGSYDRQIIVWDVETGEQLRSLQGHNGAIYDLAFTPDAKVLVSASADATVKVWNVQSGQRLDTLGQPLKEQYTVDISPDGNFIVAGGEDNRIRMWKLVSLNVPQINPILNARFAHESAIEQVRFSRDGKYIVSLSSDRMLKVWSADAVELLNSFELDSASAGAFALSTNSRTIGVGHLGGDVQNYPLQPSAKERTDVSHKALDRVVRDTPLDALQNEFSEVEPNDNLSVPMKIEIPAKIAGRIYAKTTDQDVFLFSANAGEEWILEVRAARNESPLDSHIAVLYEDGSPVPRVQLQAVRDTYFTFRGKDSNTTGDFRLHNWEEMRLNQYLYSAGEVVKLFHYPRGPDSGFNVYPNYGNRRGYFDTTPLAHALHEPAYIVEPYLVGAMLPPNGLPVFTLNYENDDDSQRRAGKDSRLSFTAPTHGNYLVVLRDVRGMQGSDFEYELLIRAPKPDFVCKILDSNPKVGAGTGKKIGFEAERIDGFNGPIDLHFSDLPKGLSISGPLQVEAGHDRAWVTLIADDDAIAPNEQDVDNIKIVASALIAGKTIKREVGSLGKIEISESPKLIVDLIPDHAAAGSRSQLPVIELQAGGTTTATIKITRIDHDGRVGFGNENGAVNAPHGVYVDNIGLNGVLIVEGQDERKFFLTAEPWVQPMERVVFVESDVDGKPTSNPVILRILAADQPKSTDQVSR